MATAEQFVPVAITRRSGFDESVHFGAAVIVAPDGDIEFALGDPGVLVYPRSSNKPLQAVAMVRAGLQLPPDLLALVCASHDGAPMHTDGALRILRSAGLDESWLANTPDLPLDRHEAATVLRRGGAATPLTMNCSGKHGGMLATCVHNGWSTDATYLTVDHPLQQCITATIDELTDETHAHIGVDGCGAPAHAFSLAGLARSFAAVAAGRAGAAGDLVYAAMTQWPEMVGGDHRDVTQFMRHVPGLMAKDGADGVFAAALPDGHGIALKVADGSDRARPPLMLALLRRFGIDTTALEPLVGSIIFGHGQPVGTVRALVP